MDREAEDFFLVGSKRWNGAVPHPLAGDGGGREILVYQQRDHIQTAFYPGQKFYSMYII